ncbi:MAG: hypothetical protein Q7S19_01520 [bacterium]|nr:hypothetical protein [bacterium]
MKKKDFIPFDVPIICAACKEIGDIFQINLRTLGFVIFPNEDRQAHHKGSFFHAKLHHIGVDHANEKISRFPWTIKVEQTPVSHMPRMFLKDKGWDQWRGKKFDFSQQPIAYVNGTRVDRMGQKFSRGFETGFVTYLCLLCASDPPLVRRFRLALYRKLFPEYLKTLTKFVESETRILVAQRGHLEKRRLELDKQEREILREKRKLKIVLLRRRS